MARIKTKTARKDYTCGKCHQPINPGDQYQWAKPGFRSRTKLIRCMKCGFKPSELKTSKMGDAMRIVEDAQEVLQKGGFGAVEDVQAVMDQAADDLDEIAREYEEAAEAFHGGGPNQENYEIVSAAAEEVRSWQAEENSEEHCEEHNEFNANCDDCIRQVEEHIIAQADDAAEHLNGVSL